MDLNNYDASLISELFGNNDSNIKLVEEFYDVKIQFEQGCLYCDDDSKLEVISNTFEKIIDLIENGDGIDSQDIIGILNGNFVKKYISNGFGSRKFYLRTQGQERLFEAFDNNVITFAIGPAGTGKTFLAVVYAYNLLKKGNIKKIIISRPVVESGESLGFLPGDLQEKVDPYLRPIYDSFDMLVGAENTAKMIEKGVLEIAPLAYMRGRTLNDACIILDEGQNTTPMQMKMFITRLGFNSKMIITGDITQIDLPPNKASGLIDVMKIVKDIEEIGIVRMHNNDVVRHPVVSKIIDAYKN